MSLYAAARAYPRYVRSEAERHRWRASITAAENLSGDAEGTASHWHATEWLCNSEIPIDAPEQPASEPVSLSERHARN